MMRNLLFLLGVWLIFSCKKDQSQPPSPGRMIKGFSLEQGQYGSASIYNKDEQYKVLVRLQPDANLKALKPIIEISDDASVSPASGTTIDVSTNKKVIYTVTAASGQSRQWEVEFRMYESTITDYDTYSIANAVNNRVMQVSGNISFNEKYLNNAGINVADPEVSTGENLKRWQEWDIIYNSTVDDIKYYQIRNLNSGLFLNANDGTGQQVRQKWELKSTMDQQLWRIEETIQDGKYQIANKANSLYLTMSGSGTGVQVTQETKLDSDPQKWAITRLPRDSYRDGEVTNFFNRTQGSVAFDQGNSIPLLDGRVLWVTQDAWYQGSLAGNGNLQGNHTISYTNSIIVQPTLTNWSPDAPMMTADGRSNGNIGNIIPKQPGKQWSWPSAGVQIGNSVYIHNREGAGLGTDDDNQALYKLDAVTPTHWNVARLAPAGLTASEKLVSYANGMVKASDGFVYVYGSRTDPNSFGFATYLHVARFPQSDPQNWTFWNGSSWTGTASVASSAHINTGLGTNYVGYINGKYVHLTMDQGFYCGIASVNMYISTSSSPTGIFTPKKLVYTFTEFYKGYNARIYTPLIHTQAVNGRNELLLTYSMNYGACPGQNDPLTEPDGTLDPYYYRVKGVRVPYEMIGL
ncbi:RICIN domain-containing protein [Pedobacter sp. BAL39]|uniref:RICIN domain-containing protein n=1 Tax=Pedobacter sp. BAL39 TaxID=391596 RepID=UPI001E633896|nr:RICIN domain-containing protein [Pedobacter sp. BAL39]